MLGSVHCNFMSRTAALTPLLALPEPRTAEAPLNADTLRQRAITPALLEPLLQLGTLYADTRGNAVFLLGSPLIPVSRFVSRGAKKLDALCGQSGCHGTGFLSTSIRLSRSMCCGSSIS